MTAAPDCDPTRALTDEIVDLCKAIKGKTELSPADLDRLERVCCLISISNPMWRVDREDL